jgi:hypothetical protein
VTHTFRNPDLVQVLPIRNLLRGQHPDHPMPTGKDGLVVNDLDLVLKYHGDVLGTPGQRTRLVEVKNGQKKMEYAQVMQFADIDYIMSRRPDRYDGFFVVNFDHASTTAIEVGDSLLEFPHDVTFTVTGLDSHHMDVHQFNEWVCTPHSPFPGMGHTEQFKNAVRKLYGDPTRTDYATAALRQMMKDHKLTRCDVFEALSNLYLADSVFGSVA